MSEIDGDRRRNVIWLNVTTGLPMRSEIHKIDASGKEDRVISYETIEINVAPPARMFNFEPPEGYRLVEEQDPQPHFNGSSAGGRNDRVSIRYAFAIDRLGVLVCWYRGVEGAEPTDPEQDPEPPEMELLGPSGRRKCELRLVRAQLESGKLWRWSLAMPIDRRPLGPDENFVMQFKTPNLHATFEDSPLRLEDERLKRVLTELKELGTAAGEPQPEMTLVRLRWLASQYLTQ
jgi:hypothetical protein